MTHFDLSQLDSRSGSKKLHFFKLRHPATGEPIIAAPEIGEPGAEDYQPAKFVEVGVYGVENEDVQKKIADRKRDIALDAPNNAKRKHIRGRVNPVEPEKEAEMTNTQAHEKAAFFAVPLVGELRNMCFNGSMLSAESEDDVWTFLNLQTMTPRSLNGGRAGRSFLEQVLEAAGERQNFLGNA